MAQSLTTSAVAVDSLAGMKTLSSTVAYWEPAQQQSPSPSTSSSHTPQLVIVFSWMGARDEHIAKYLARYRALFPTSHIVLIRCPTSHMWLPWLARRDMRPALPVLRTVAEAVGYAEQRDGGQHPRVLVHIFSNGGLSTAVNLRTVFLNAGLHRHFGPSPTLPRYVLVLDSCPGFFRWDNTHRAFSQMLPRWASPLMHVAIAMACVLHSLARRLPFQTQNAQVLYDPSLAVHECRRTYLYGSADAMVSFRDVQDHALEAIKRGFLVRQERFEGASHVALAKSDLDRYWAAVQQSWERSCEEPLADGPRRRHGSKSLTAKV